ncbi:hypothetical protein KV541_04920 [Halobacterium salinarum]|nr:hypothetical protein [Halobacterium salinarum]MCF2167495.1 hypothetical protein [Halobacterium salinarum]
MTDRTVTILDRGCGDKQNVISPDYDESADQLHVDGLLSGTRECGDLAVTYAASSPEERIIVEIVVTNGEACVDCTHYYDYEATVTFRETPDVVAIAHSDPKVLDMRALIIEEDRTTIAHD